MLQNLQVQDSLVLELAEIEAKLLPLQTRKEEIKEALRAFGPNTYENAIATVTVAAASTIKKVGQRLAMVPDLWQRLKPETQEDCTKTGFIFTEDVFSRAAKSAVSVQLK